MRKLALLITASSLLPMAPTPAQVQVYDSKGQRREFATQEEANRYIEGVNAAAAQRSQEIQQSLPIDFRDCVVQVFMDSMQPKKSQHYFIDNLDDQLQKSLREHGVNAQPGSTFPKKWLDLQNHSHHTPYWQFSYSFASVITPGEEYAMGVGFHCGTLCMSQVTYVVKIEGNACKVASKRVEMSA